MKNKGTNKGITLIALVITIIVMLILVAVTITMAINGGLFSNAGTAVGETQNAINAEQNLGTGDIIDRWVNGVGPVSNPYETDEWEMAWTCTDGTWSDVINKGETAEGQIVAKLYLTGEKVTPGDVESVLVNGVVHSFSEGDAYALVIEGKGEMGPLGVITNGRPTGAYAWLIEMFMLQMEQVDTCKSAYITDVYICDGITKVSDFAFAFFSGLKNVNISYDVENIGVGAFLDCNNLTSVTIPDSVTSIGNGAFSNCDGLTKITIPNSVTSLENEAFYGCSSLTSVTIPNSVTSIGDWAFSNCESLTNITIPNSVTSIGERAFFNCESLTNITIPNSVTSIGEGTFADCESLTNITIPNSVTSIGDWALSFCSKVTNVTFKGTVEQWGEITLGKGWTRYTGCPVTEVICSDGVVKLD